MFLLNPATGADFPVAGVAYNVIFLLKHPDVIFTTIVINLLPSLHLLIMNGSDNYYFQYFSVHVLHDQHRRHHGLISSYFKLTYDKIY